MMSQMPRDAGHEHRVRELERQVQHSHTPVDAVRVGTVLRLVFFFTFLLVF
jgi:hypothetical protein